MTTRSRAAFDVLADARPSFRSVATSVAAGLVAVLVAAAVRVLLNPLLGAETPFITFFPAVAAAAWAGGIVGGLVATIVGVPLATLLLGAPGGLTEHDIVRVAVFAIGGAIISALGGNLHATREGALRAAARADFLAAASAILARRLDALGTVEALARVAVPAFADWCAIDLLGEDGRFDGVRIAHTDPEKVALGYRLRREHPLDPDDASGPPAVVRTGDPEFLPDIPRDYTSAIEDGSLGDIMARLDLRSYICVPLVVRGRALGALTVVMSESHRRFGPDDLATAVDLAARAAVAIDHARLYSRVRARGEELDRIIASMEEGVIVADADGRTRSYNPAAERILGAPPVSIQETLGRLVTAADGPLAPGDVMSVPATGRSVRIVRSDVEAEGEASRILVLRDVTELLESQAARDTFVGMLSHEIRTPITTIYGTSQVLLRPLADDLRMELMRDLATETDRLYRLVEDLLVLSRYEREALDIVPEPVLLQRLLPTVAAGEQQRWPGVMIRLEVEPDLPPVVADQTYVEQVVRNLLSNAAKYGGTDASVALRARADGGEVTVEVADQGPGIPHGSEEAIFHLYERLPDARRSGTPGAGIGLFVCRRLVELMGGRIWARSGPEGGAILSFSLPVYGEAGIAATPVPVPASRVEAGVSGMGSTGVDALDEGRPEPERADDGQVDDGGVAAKPAPRTSRMRIIRRPARLANER